MAIKIKKKKFIKRKLSRNFKVSDSAEHYRLTFEEGSYSGDAGLKLINISFINYNCYRSYFF